MSLRLLQGAATFSILALLNFTSLSLGVFDQHSRSGGWLTGHFYHLALPFPGFPAWKKWSPCAQKSRALLAGVQLSPGREELPVNAGRIGGGAHLLWSAGCHPGEEASLGSKQAGQGDHALGHPSRQNPLSPSPPTTSIPLPAPLRTRIFSP